MSSRTMRISKLACFASAVCSWSRIHAFVSIASGRDRIAFVSSRSGHAPTQSFSTKIFSSRSSPNQRGDDDRGRPRAFPSNDDGDDRLASEERTINPFGAATDAVTSRREAFASSSRALGSALLSSVVVVGGGVGSSTASGDVVPSGKTIIVTGCNSGIGFDAVRRMASRSDNGANTIVLACRTLAKAEEAAARVRDDPSFFATTTLVPAECDLSSLRSIKTFVESATLADALRSRPLDALCLNAGLALDVAAKEVARTADGFELTVGTNHLGHFYLSSLLLPMINPDTGRVVVTASGVHDPDSPGGAQGSKATLGDLRGLEEQGRTFTMVDGGPYDADKAYKDSKLCNVLFTRELQRRLSASKSGVKAYCFNPGLIVGTGLFRDQNPLFTKVFDVAATNLFKVGETTSFGGGALEYVALDPAVGAAEGGSYYTSPPGSGKYGDAAYGKQFTVSQVSKEARDDDKARRLWALSEKLVGLA